MGDFVLLCAGLERILPVGQCNLPEIDLALIGARQVRQKTADFYGFKGTDYVR